MKTALLLVDVQNDFFPGGPLATPEGDGIIEPVNRLIEMFERNGLPTYATRDWHPEGHCSFKEQGGPWPPHCIRETPGAAFNPAIQMPDSAVILSKATTQDRDAYSGFDGTDLADRLRQTVVSSLVVAGLATDVCVKNTVFGGLEEGFDVTVVREAISGVEAQPGDSEKAMQEMVDKGARLVSIDHLDLNASP